MVGRLFLGMPRGCLRLVIVVFPDHTHLLFLVDSGACSGRNILTSLVYVRYNVSTGLASVCGNFVASHVQILRGIGGLHQTKL